MADVSYIVDDIYRTDTAVTVRVGDRVTLVAETILVDVGAAYTSVPGLTFTAVREGGAVYGVDGYVATPGTYTIPLGLGTTTFDQYGSFILTVLGPSMNVKVDDEWKSSNSIQVKVDGSWKTATYVYTKVDDNWKEV